MLKHVLMSLMVFSFSLIGFGLEYLYGCLILLIFVLILVYYLTPLPFDSVYFGMAVF